MLRTAGELKGVTIEAMDGDIGSVQDLYFDDQTWTVRYVNRIGISKQELVLLGGFIQPRVTRHDVFAVDQHAMKGDH